MSTKPSLPRTEVPRPRLHKEQSFVVRVTSVIATIKSHTGLGHNPVEAAFLEIAKYDKPGEYSFEVPGGNEYVLIVAIDKPLEPGELGIDLSPIED